MMLQEGWQKDKSLKILYKLRKDKSRTYRINLIKRLKL